MALVLLAAAAGAVDGTSLTALGHVFAGVMTGNLTLLGIAAGRGRFGDVVPSLIALTGYITGTAVTARVCAGDTDARHGWRPRILQCLTGEVVLLTTGAVVWAAVGGAPGQVLRDVLLCGAAVAMGAQSGAMIAAGPAGKPSTYLTGTLTTYLLRSIAGGHRGADPWAPVRLGAVVAGAACAVLIHRHAMSWTAVLPPVLVLTAVLIAARAPRRPGGDAAPAAGADASRTP